MAPPRKSRAPQPAATEGDPPRPAAPDTAVDAGPAPAAARARTKATGALARGKAKAAASGNAGARAPQAAARKAATTATTAKAAAAAKAAKAAATKTAKAAATKTAKAAARTTAKAAATTAAARPPPPAAKAARRRLRRPKDAFSSKIHSSGTSEMLTVRRMHRRDIKKVWSFLKLVFRDVNRETVEYQRPRSRERFEESYDDEGVEQLVFEVGDEVVGYAECAYEVTGSDNWINQRYFDARDMRPLFVEELATHPGYQGRGVGSFMMEQLEHLARLRGCTHLVLEVAENNEAALSFYRHRNFYKLDAAIFMAKKVGREPELLPPQKLRPAPPPESAPDGSASQEPAG